MSNTEYRLKGKPVGTGSQRLYYKNKLKGFLGRFVCLLKQHNITYDVFIVEDIGNGYESRRNMIYCKRCRREVEGQPIMAERW